MLLYLTNKDAQTLIEILDWYKLREELITSDLQNNEEIALCDSITEKIRAML